MLKLRSRVVKLKPHAQRFGYLMAALFIIGFAIVGIKYLFTTHAQSLPSVAGQSYEICNQASQYLTSPYTYDSLASGSQTYTVAQYEALAGYGTTLPSLPSYISSQPSTTEAAEIFAPGASVNLEAYNFPETPIIYFFEGGSYGELSLASISGDEFIGGSTASYQEPTFNDGGNAGGIDAQNATYQFSGGGSTVASTASAGATSLTTTSSIPGYLQYLTFDDGTTDQISSYSGTSFSLSNPLTNSESSGNQVWGSQMLPIAFTATALSQGATTVTLGASSTPLVSWGNIEIGASNYQIKSISGSQSGYTITLTSGLDTSYNSDTPVYVGGGLAGDVSVKYLNIADDIHVSDGTLYTGSGWTITNNDIHDGYSSSVQGGVAILGGDESTIEYNCFSRMGQYAFNVSGTNITIDYNEVYQTNYENITICGCAGAGKWWGTLNANIVDNAFMEDDIGTNGITIWLDNGNSGTQISGNYFYKDYSNAISNETGYNSDITGNLFYESGWGNGSGACGGGTNCSGTVSLNSSGGINIPGSRYENQLLIQNNTFYNDWQGVDIWQSAGQRDCLVSNEGTKGATGDSPYCSGGFPNTSYMASNNTGTINYYFSHYQFTTDQLSTYIPTVATGCSSSCSQIAVSQPMAMHDQIGFSDPALVTDTTDSMAVSSCTNSTPCTLTVPSTSGFPTSGKLLADTTTADAVEGGFTGAILSYSGLTGTTFTGVQLVTCSSSTPISTCGGSGNLLGSTGSQLQEIEPYEVTGETCYTNVCDVTVSPSIPSVAAGSLVDQSGTCRLFLTASASPTAPLAPNGVSYFDGCQWLVKNISVSSNTFVFQPSIIASSAPVVGGGSTTNCSATYADACGTNFMQTQIDCGGGSNCDPYENQIMANAMMSNSTFTGCPSWDSGCTSDPLNNLNALSNAAGAPANNDEAPANNLWSGNTYDGPWGFYAYIFGNCSGGGVYMPSDPTTGKGLTAASCGESPPLSLAQWQADWQQDSGSTYSATGSLTGSSTSGSTGPSVSITNLSPNQEIHSTTAIDATATPVSGTTISSCQLLVNGSNVDNPITTAPYNFSLDTLNYESNGIYTISVSCTDSSSNVGSASVPVYIANGDLNGKGEVCLSDLAILGGNFDKPGTFTYSQGNITGATTDPEVNISDLAILGAPFRWGWVENGGVC
ncbi:MAG: Ig-like domain-containing protein [Candidatus Saccharimonadales bacterium]